MYIKPQQTQIVNKHSKQINKIPTPPSRLTIPPRFEYSRPDYHGRYLTGLLPWVEREVRRRGNWSPLPRGAGGTGGVGDPGALLAGEPCSGTSVWVEGGPVLVPGVSVGGALLRA